MILGKSCPFYENSRCLTKNASCDLVCTLMGYDQEEVDDTKKEPSGVGNKVPFWLGKSGRHA
jgi:hypothetical protein